MKQNLTSVEIQVNRLKARKSMLLYYTGDEPDGQVGKRNITKSPFLLSLIFGQTLLMRPRLRTI
jgi:hypothetical protein